MKRDSIRIAVPLLSAFLLIVVPACSLSEDSGQAGTSTDPALVSHAEEPAPQVVSASSGHEFDTDWTVHAGDQIEIRPVFIDHERREVAKPVVTRTDQSVCVKEIDVCTADEPVFQMQCAPHCKVCTKCDLLVFCHIGTCCEDSCANAEVGRHCTHYERGCVFQQNQWHEETSYGPLGPITHEHNLNPMKESALMLSGLKFKLVFSGAAAAGASANCPLSRYQPKLDADRITVTLGDQPGCPASFAAHPGQAAKLSLVNEMSEPIHYTQGDQVKSWDGKVVGETTDQTYHPEIDFEATLTLLLGTGTP